MMKSRRCFVVAVGLVLGVTAAVFSGMAQNDVPAPDRPNHLLVLIDDSGSMRMKNSSSWGLELSSFLLETCRKMETGDNPSRRVIYDPGHDYLSVFFFGLEKKSELSFQKDFFNVRECFSQGRSLDESFVSDTLASGSFGRNLTALTLALNLGLHHSRSCAPAGIQVADTWLLLITDGESNLSAGDNSEIDGLEKHFRNTRESRFPKSEGFDYVHSVFDGIFQVYDLQKEVYREDSFDSRYRYYLVRVRYKTTGEVLNCINPTPDLEFHRQGMAYTGSLPIRLRSECSALLSPVSATVHLRLGDYTEDTTLEFPAAGPFALELNREIPVESAAPGDRGEARIDFLFQVADDIYGLGLVSQSQTVNLKVQDAPILFEPLGIKVPDWLYGMFPDLDQGSLHSRALVALWVSAFVGLLMIGYPLYYVLSWPRSDFRIKNRDNGLLSGGKVLEVQVGANREQSKELVTVFGVEGAQLRPKRFGIIPLRKEPFALDCRIGPDPKSASSGLAGHLPSFGFSWDLQNPHRVNECYPGNEINLFFDPSRLREYPAKPGDYDLRLRADFGVGDRNLSVQTLTGKIRFKPEPARPRLVFESIDSDEVQRDGDSRPLLQFRRPPGRCCFGWLDLSNQVVHECCQPLDVEEIVIELWRQGESLVKTGIFPISGYRVERQMAPGPDGDGGGWRDAGELEGDAGPTVKLADDGGRYRLQVLGLVKDWRVRIPLSLDFSDPDQWEFPPEGAGHDYVVKATLRGNDYFPDMVESFPFVLAPGDRESIFGVGVGEDENDLEYHWFRGGPRDASSIDFLKSKPIIWKGSNQDGGVTARISYLHLTNSAHDGDGQVAVRLKPSDHDDQASDYRITMEPGGKPWTYPKWPSDLFSLFIRGHGSFAPAPLTSTTIEHTLPNLGSERPCYQLHFIPQILDKLEHPAAVISLAVPLQYRIDAGTWKDLTVNFSFTVQKDLGDMVVGIDMGTSAIVAVTATDEESSLDSQESVLNLQKQYLDSCQAKGINSENPESETRFIPSVIYVDLAQSEDSDDFVHLPAERLNMLNYPGQVVPFLKSYIGLGSETVPIKQTIVGQRKVSIAPRDVKLKSIVTAAYQKLWGPDYLGGLCPGGKVPDRVVITYPNTFSIIQLFRLNQWLQSCDRLQDSRFSFVSESNAVAFYYLGGISRRGPDPAASGPRQRLLIYDLGAGTLDISVLDVNRDPETGRIDQIEVVHKMGLPLGGNIVDVLCARIIDRRLEAIAATLAEHGVKTEFINKIVPKDVIANSDEKVNNYRICMTPIRKLIQEHIKPALKDRDGPAGTFNLAVPLALDSRPVMTFELVTPVGDADEDQEHLDALLLEHAGIRMVTRDAGSNYLVPLDARLFSAHFEPGGLFHQYLTTVVENSLVNVAANIKRAAGIPSTSGLAVDTLIISGRASRFADLAKRVTAELTRLNQGHPLRVVELKGQELKHCVAQGALLYEYLFREVSIIDRSIYGKFGFWTDADGAGLKRFVELLGPDSYRRHAPGRPQVFQNTTNYLPEAETELEFPSDCFLYFGMTYEDDPQAAVNAIEPGRDGDYFRSSRLVRLKKSGHRVAKGKAKIKMSVEWDRLAGISYLAAEVNHDVLQLMSTDAGGSITPLPQMAVGGHDIESIWPMEPLQLLSSWPEIETKDGE